jgi:hypothetical protein
MRKSDLKDGMVIEWDSREKGVIINDSIRYEIGFDRLSILSEDLAYKGDKINKIFIVKEKCCGLSSIFIDDNLELIWERKREIDWNKVPKWTRVQVRDFKNEEWRNAYWGEFVENDYNNNFGITFNDEFTFNEKTNVYLLYKEIRLHPFVNAKEEWYK